MSAPRICVPKNDLPQKAWSFTNRGWTFLVLLWPTDGTAANHKWDLTGLAWKDGVVVARNHWGFKVWNVTDVDHLVYLGYKDSALFDETSHNPHDVWRKRIGEGYDELAIPEPPRRGCHDRTSALADMRHFYDTVIRPDTSAVTFPDTWTDPRVLAWCLHNRYKYRIKLARRGYFRKVDPRSLWLELPDLFYDLYRKLH